MSTIIGRPERIAVEFEILSAQRLADEFGLVSTTKENDLSKWIYGYMCLWAGGLRIGRGDELCAMTVAMAGFPDIIRNKGRRSDPALMRMAARAAFRMIHGALYGQHAQLTYRQLQLMSERFERYCVLHRGFDILDGWDAYLIEDHLIGRLIWRGLDKQIRETRLGPGEFDRVIDEFLTAVEHATGYQRGQPGA